MDLRKILLLPCMLVVLGTAAQQDMAGLVARGDSLLAQQKPQRALQCFDEAVKKDPSSAHYSARARAWYLMDRMDRYLQDVEMALRLDSSNAEAHYQRALYAFRAEDWPRAEQHAGKAMILGAGTKIGARAAIVRGEARAERKHIKGAIEDLRAGLEEGLEDSEAMRTLARLLDAEGEHEEALVLLERLCAKEPGDVGHWTNRGFELARLDRHQEALSMYDRALTLDKDEPVALSDRAASLLELGRDDEAWTDVERSLRSYPANPFALYTRARLLLKRGEREKACKDLTLARTLGDISEVSVLLEEHCGGATPQR